MNESSSQFKAIIFIISFFPPVCLSFFEKYSYHLLSGEFLLKQNYTYKLHFYPIFLKNYTKNSCKIFQKEV